MRIGRIVRILTDNSRKEILENTDRSRRIIISIFYPADNNCCEVKQGLYMDLYHPCEEEFIKRYAGVKNTQGQEVSESYLRSIKTNIHNNIPIIKEQAAYPVILFSPGFGFDRDFQIYNIEKLVSEGYIVVTVGHFYDPDFIVLPDGEIIERSFKLPKLVIEDIAQSIHVGDAIIEAMGELTDIRKQDILFLLDELATLNNEDEFIKGRLNLHRIGIMGHSLGGTAVFRAASEDMRIKAIILLDASLQLFDLKKELSCRQKLQTPLLSFRRGSTGYAEEMKKFIETNAGKMDGDAFKKNLIMRHQVLIGQAKGQNQLNEYLSGYKSFIKIKNSNHTTFADWPIIRNIQLENGVLPIKEAHEVISEISARFYNEFLCGKIGEYSSFINSDNCPQICITDKDEE